LKYYLLITKAFEATKIRFKLLLLLAKIL